MTINPNAMSSQKNLEALVALEQDGTATAGQIVDALAELDPETRILVPTIRDIAHFAVQEFFDGRLVIDPLFKQVNVDGKDIEITPREFDLLSVLTERPNEYQSSVAISERVWGKNRENTLTPNILRLRDRLAPLSTFRRKQADWAGFKDDNLIRNKRPSQYGFFTVDTTLNDPN